MKILHMHTKMVSGGIEAMVCGLVNELVKENSVTLCTIFEPGSDDIFLKRISSNVKKETIGKKHYGFSIREIFRIYRYIKTGNFDVVHVHGCFQYYILAILMLWHKTKFIYTVHSDAKMENQKWESRLFYLKKLCFRKRLVYPVTISKSSQQSFNEVYDTESTLIFNGTPKPLKCEIDKTIQYRLTADTKVFIHPGRICKAKNQIVLCSVFNQLIKDGKDVVLLIAGMMEDVEIFKEIKPYLNNRIIYLGERDDITDLMQYCDGFCLPSIWEGLPVTLLESFATGCIPICSPVGGIKDVINNKINGFISNSSSESDYYETMKCFLDCSLQDLSIMQKKCIESFTAFNISTTAKKYNNLYLGLINSV